MIYLGNGMYSAASLSHGYTWSKHKYIRKEGNRYIYPEDLKKDLNSAGKKITQTAASAKNTLNRKLIKSGIKESAFEIGAEASKTAKEEAKHLSRFADWRPRYVPGIGLSISNQSGVNAAADAIAARKKNAEKAARNHRVEAVNRRAEENKSRASGELAVQRAKAARRKNAAKAQANTQRDFERAKYEAGQKAHNKLEKEKETRANAAFASKAAAHLAQSKDRIKYLRGQKNRMYTNKQLSEMGKRNAAINNAKNPEKSWIEEGYDTAVRGLNAAGRKLTQTGASAKNTLNRKLIRSGIKKSSFDIVNNPVNAGVAAFAAQDNANKNARYNTDKNRPNTTFDNTKINDSYHSGINAASDAINARQKNAAKKRAADARLATSYLGSKAEGIEKRRRKKNNG